MKLLKQILIELQKINKTLHNILRILEQKDSVEFPINYFGSDPEKIATIRNKDIARVISDINDLQRKINPIAYKSEVKTLSKGETLNER